MATAAPTVTVDSLEAEIADLRRQYQTYAARTQPRLSELHAQITEIMNAQREEDQRVRVAISTKRHAIADILDSQTHEPGTVQHTIRYERPTTSYSAADQETFTRAYRLLTPSEIELEFGECYEDAKEFADLLERGHRASNDENSMSDAVDMLLRRDAPTEQRARILWLKNYRRIQVALQAASGNYSPDFVLPQVAPPFY